MESESQNTTSSDPLEQRVASLEGKNIPPGLLALCILTILGSVFGIFRVWLYEFGAMVAGNETYVRGLLYLIFHAGTLAGAIMMLRRSMSGIYLYSISQILYIVLVMYTIYGTYDGGIGSFFASVIGPMFWLPSLVFLILYWALPIKKCLK